MQESASLRRTALVLVLVGLLWNLVEAVVAFWAGLQAGSVAVLAFGLDSIIELLAGAVLVWRLRTEREESAAEDAERKAQRLLGISFFLLAAYVFIHSGSSILGWLPQPQPSLAGVIIVAASAIVMAALYVAKMRIAVRMQSRALRAEAMESLFCDLQDLGILFGLALNTLFSWWWADPVSALIIVPFFIKEGLENFYGHDDDHERYAPRVCFGPECLFALRTCRAPCCQPST